MKPKLAESLSILANLLPVSTDKESFILYLYFLKIKKHKQNKFQILLDFEIA